MAHYLFSCSSGSRYFTPLYPLGGFLGFVAAAPTILSYPGGHGAFYLVLSRAGETVVLQALYLKMKTYLFTLSIIASRAPFIF